MSDTTSEPPARPEGRVGRRERYLLGIDVGTSAVKALLLESVSGRSHVAAERCQPRFGPGVVEAPPTGWWEAARRAVAAVLHLAGVGGDAVEIVSLAGNMSSVVLLDNAFRPLRSAILLADTRGEAELRALPTAVKRRVAALSGNPLGFGFSLSKLLWLSFNEPELMSRAAVWVAAKDFVRECLTGAVATDPSDAFNSLVLDPADLRWRSDLIGELGLDPQLFPPVLPGDALAGAVSSEAAAATGLRVGTPVVTGTGDVAAVACAAGWLATPVPTVSLGTSTTLMVPRPGAARPPEGFSVHPVLPGRPWLLLASLLTGGLALDWLRRLGPLELQQVGDLEPEQLPVFLPYLSGRGSPDFDTTQRGTIFGLDPSVGLPQLAASLFAAVGFELRDCLVALGVRDEETVMVTGGGVAVNGFVQLLADTMRREVLVRSMNEATALGAALVAAGPERAGKLVRTVGTQHRVSPRAGSVDALEERYRLARQQAGEFYRALERRAGTHPMAGLPDREHSGAAHRESGRTQRAQGRSPVSAETRPRAIRERQ